MDLMWLGTTAVLHGELRRCTTMCLIADVGLTDHDAFETVSVYRLIHKIESLHTVSYNEDSNPHECNYLTSQEK